MRGWNWGKAEFGKAELTFNVQSRPAFEIPYSEISNTNLAGRNEIAVEFASGEGGKGKGKGKRAAAGKDQLVEMRFYIPGTTTKKEAEGGAAGSDAEEEKNAVSLFYDTLMEKAEIGETAGDTIATFLDVLHLTPRYVVSMGPCPSLCCTNGCRSACLLTFGLPPRPEDVSISTCTIPHSGSGARRTTTRSNTKPSRSSWFFQSRTISTACW